MSVRALLLALPLMAAGPAEAQNRVALGGGVMISSTLVNDSLVRPLALRASPGPLLSIAATTRLDSAHQIGLNLAVTWTSLQRRTATEVVRITTLNTWAPAVSLHRALGGQVSARLSAGIIMYRPDHSDATVFRSGAPTLPMLGGGVTLERGYRGVLLSADLGYDAHRFSTRALRDDGFRGEQLVHRVALTLSVSRAGWP